MQDSSLYSQIKPRLQSRFPEQEQVKCPRCDSTNTKFCYYNNYNLSQPRHFCKSCRRYWTKGGALRNIPVGGGSRKNSKRSSTSSSTNTSAATKRPAPVSTSDNKNDAKFNNNSETAGRLPPKGENFGLLYGSLLEGGCFTSLLDSTVPLFGPQCGNFLDGLGPNGAGLGMGDHFDPGSGQIFVGPDMELDSGGSSNAAAAAAAAAADEFLNVQGGGDGGDTGDCGGGNGGPGVSI